MRESYFKRIDMNSLYVKDNKFTSSFMDFATEIIVTAINNQIKVTLNIYQDCKVVLTKNFDTIAEAFFYELEYVAPSHTIEEIEEKYQNKEKIKNKRNQTQYGKVYHK